jgi:histidine triad (HIT) family protein
MSHECIFCALVRDPSRAVVLHEDDDLVAFLDTSPVRPGHTLIVPREHVETFGGLSPEIAGRSVLLGQQLALRMKAVYGVERVAFAFIGTGVAHTHAHVIPMHDQSDVISGRYVASPAPLALSMDHLRVDRAALEAERARLAFRAS